VSPSFSHNLFATKIFPCTYRSNSPLSLNKTCSDETELALITLLVFDFFGQNNKNFHSRPNAWKMFGAWGGSGGYFLFYDYM
jgi:hypothetical protein